MKKKEKMAKGIYWRKDDGFSLKPEENVTLLLDNTIFFGGNCHAAGG